MDTITQIKQKLNIVDVIGDYIELKKSGRNYKGVCPFHIEKSPSFMVSQELQIFKCFGCGESGDVFGFVQKLEGVDFPTALEQLAEKAGIKVEKDLYDPHGKKKKLIYEINMHTSAFFSYLLTKHKAGEEGMKYLTEKRKLTLKTIEEFHVGYAPNEWNLLQQFLTKKGYKDEDLEDAGVVVKKHSSTGHIDKFRGRIMFPLIGIDNKIVGFTGRAIYDQEPKYLNTPETLVFHKGSFIYGLNKAKVDVKRDGAVFVEGQMDVISAHQAGITNVVSSSGTALTEAQLRAVSRFTNDITFCFDSDTAGHTATLRAIELAEKLNLNIKTAIIPPEYTDLDELIKAKPTGAKNLLDKPVPIYDYFISNALGKHEKKTALGKKRIIEELIPKFEKLSNKVMRDHYIKQIAQELDLDTQVVGDLITAKKQIATDAPEPTNIHDTTALPDVEEIRLENYALALIYNAKLELAQNILYKLAQKDFLDELNRDLFIRLKAYVLGRKRKTDIKYFISKLDGNLKLRAEDIHLLDLGGLSQNENLLEKELDTVFKRLKSETINRELEIIRGELKSAEKVNDLDEIEQLSQKVYKISKLKKQYE